MRLKWHRIYSGEGADYVADGASQNYLAVRYAYGWELFCLPHGETHPAVVDAGPWDRLRDVKAHAQMME
ncbi:hypothetical protein KNU44_gp115 [Mycobacterium phage CicholasNage]|uniref:Uncharacterized protein n=1 Tax=Mycobacterium phage CicholasNage TaxID=2500799 RepID=A0A411BPF6_9CAUD|nr:hypothetical protein KNU44_gp115 [Mycobacterium phage CicholasNage]QAY03517.1 hypothetical protein SEA_CICHOLASNAGE_105 [Mycobacterium phage CicholasNage]